MSSAFAGGATLGATHDLANGVIGLTTTINDLDTGVTVTNNGNPIT